MFNLTTITANDKPTFYAELQAQARALLNGESDWLANMSQFASLIFHSLPDLNWAGFYLYKEDQLVLGPFQGKVACVRIAMGKGVCGTSAQKREIIIVPDVHEFPEHIACDVESRSEIVLPLIKENALLGVFDLDSPVTARFDHEDADGLEKLVNILIEKSRRNDF